MLCAGTVFIVTTVVLAGLLIARLMIALPITRLMLARLLVPRLLVPRLVVALAITRLEVTRLLVAILVIISGLMVTLLVVTLTVARLVIAPLVAVGLLTVLAIALIALVIAMAADVALIAVIFRTTLTLGHLLVGLTQHAGVMLCVLQKALFCHAIMGQLGVTRQSQILLDDLLGGATHLALGPRAVKDAVNDIAQRALAVRFATRAGF